MPELNITIKIAEENLEEFKAGWLKAIEKPEQYAGLNDIQFFKKWLEDNIINAYKSGKILIARETTQPEIIEGIIEVL